MAAGPLGRESIRSLLRGYLLDEAEFSFLARVIKDIDVVPNMAILLKTKLGAAIKRNIQPLVALANVNSAVVKFERIG